MADETTVSTLATKLHVPPLRADSVVRERLIRRIEEGAREGRTLTLVSASAGFGKTTLITAWLHSNARTCAWLSLDDGDNDPIRFWRYVIAALQTADSRIGSAALAMLSAPQLPPLESPVTVFTGPVADQAALYGLISRMRDLGLPLISVERV